MPKRNFGFLITALIAPLVALSPASAAKLPKDMLGTWCLDAEYNEHDKTRYERGDCHAKPDIDGGWMILRRRTLHGPRYDCKAIKTTLAPDYRLGGDKFVIEYRCKGEGKMWNERMSFSYDERRELLYLRNEPKDAPRADCPSLPKETNPCDESFKD
jgi:hypothetical protein